jgi:hypothetical protein
MVYMCGGENERMRISDDSYLGWYNVNQYPGANFCMGADPESDCSLTEQPTKELVNSTASHNAGGPFYWEAGTATDNDTELVVRWSPNLTNCKSSTDASCQGLGTVEGYDHSAYYQTRLVVYQQYGGATCNKDFGSWGSSTCGQPDHHCDTYSYLDVFPIVTGWGNNGWCGSTNPDRTFKIYTQIKKTYDNHNPYGSDLVVTGGTTAKTNLAVYAR